MFISVAFGNFFHIFKKILLKFAEVAPVGAWIEIMLVTGARKAVMEVAPVGAWIEISGYTEGRRRSGKSPLLGRGLKYLVHMESAAMPPSVPHACPGLLGSNSPHFRPDRSQSQFWMGP